MYKYTSFFMCMSWSSDTHRVIIFLIAQMLKIHKDVCTWHKSDTVLDSSSTDGQFWDKYILILYICCKLAQAPQIFMNYWKYFIRHSTNNMDYCNGHCSYNNDDASILDSNPFAFYYINLTNLFTINKNRCTRFVISSIHVHVLLW